MLGAEGQALIQPQVAVTEPRTLETCVRSLAAWRYLRPVIAMLSGATEQGLHWAGDNLLPLAVA